MRYKVRAVQDAGKALENTALSASTEWRGDNDAIISASHFGRSEVLFTIQMGFFDQGFQAAIAYPKEKPYEIKGRGRFSDYIPYADQVRIDDFIATIRGEAEMHAARRGPDLGEVISEAVEVRGPQEVIDALQEFLLTQPEEVRYAAIRRLAELGNPPSPAAGV